MNTVEPLIATPKHRHLLSLSLLILVVAFIHVPSLFFPFFLDDYVFLERVHQLDGTKLISLFRSSTMDETASGVWWVPTGTLPFYRPIGLLTFAIDHYLWGLRPFGFHVTNLLLHLVCTFLTWRFAWRLLPDPSFAFAVALVFALHPVHSEAVSWISGRFDLLVCAMTLASALSYLKWKDQASPCWGLLSALWFIIGLGCKETALILPAILLSIEVIFPQASGRTRRAAILLFMFGAISMCYLAGRIALFGSPLGSLPPPYGLDKSTPMVAVENIAWNLIQYVLDFALFIPVEPVYLAQFWRANPLLLGTALTVSALLVTGAAMIARTRLFVVGLLWLMMFTAPSLLSMPGERNVYLAGVGLALVISAVFFSLLSRNRDTTRNGFRSPERTWPRRTAYVVVAIWSVIGIAKQAGFGSLSLAGERVYRDLQMMLPNPPQDARIFVVNQSPLNSVGFAQAIRLRYNRPDLSAVALSLSPSLKATSFDEITVTGPDSMRLVRANGTFFDSFVERFHRFSEPASSLPLAAQRFGLELIAPPSSLENVTMISFRLPHPLGDPRIEVFQWDNQRVRSVVDLFRMGSRTELKRPVCNLQFVPQAAEK